MGCKQGAVDHATTKQQYASYDDYPVYNGNDLGLTYLGVRSVFRLWAPTADSVFLRLYKEGSGGKPVVKKAMALNPDGIWIATLEGDWQGYFYTYQAVIDGKEMKEVPDPYSIAAGVNGLRSYIIDLKTTNPVNWHLDKKPPLKSYNDIIIYELHVRDFSIHPASGIEARGKYLGVSETGTRGPGGVTTGLDHLKELGVTHIHLLPVFDHKSIDESRLDSAQFNWGYDPHLYNVPEGSYSTDPYDPFSRIYEFKQMVQNLHLNGIRIVMDVVYNHTGETENSVFNQLVPGYYYRHNADGSFSNASGCGNEIATERPMVRNFIVQSVKFWAEEYHVDGFRFDLMGIIDIETMNAVRAALDAIDSSIFIYGEGWTAGPSPYPDSLRALKKNTGKLNRIAVFCDEMRDGIKGHWNDKKDRGFVSGKPGMEESVKFGIAAACYHPQIDYSKVNYSKKPWAKAPYQCINYVSCHDDNTLWDKLEISAPEATEEERIRMAMLANTIVLTAQGVPFLHAGVDFLRTKYGDHNSYKSPDTINQLDWLRKSKYLHVFEYYKALIHLRKSCEAFRMTTASDIEKHIQFIPVEKSNLLGYSIKGYPNAMNWDEILVFFNGNNKSVEIGIPAGRWKFILKDYKINLQGIERFEGGKLTLPAISALILVSENRP